MIGLICFDKAFPDDWRKWCSC